jgi:hypothetical protein
MKRPFRYAGCVLAIVAGTFAAQAPRHPTTPVEQYQELLKGLQGRAAAYWQTTNDTERQAIVVRTATDTVRMLELVEQNPKEEFALEALTHVVTQEYWLNTYTSYPGWGQESPQVKAIALLLRDHLQSERLGETCKRVGFGFRHECETFLRTVLAKSPHREVQGQACLRLAQFLAERVEKLDSIREQPKLTQRYEDLFGEDYIRALRRQDPAQIMKEAEALYQQASESYGTVKLPYDETVGEVAQRDLFEIQHLKVGKAAGEIDGEDEDRAPFRLSDYRGKVVLLYFWSEY